VDLQQIWSKNTYHIPPSHNNSVCQCTIWQIIGNTPNTTWNPMVGVGIQHGRLGQKKRKDMAKWVSGNTDGYAIIWILATCETFQNPDVHRVFFPQLFMEQEGRA